QVVPGLGTLSAEREALGPLREEAGRLNKQFNEVTPKVREQEAAVPGLTEVVNDRTAANRERRKAQERIDTLTRHLKEAPESDRAGIEAQLQEARGRLAAA